MDLLVMIAIFVGGLVIGFLFRKMAFEKTVGCLILNENNPSEYFEFHFEKDIDDIPTKGVIGFHLVRR